jgi:hypothetical protein
MGLKDIPEQLQIDSEEDLRAMVLSYCSELGFDPDEISCEDYFSIKLGHHAITIDKKMVGGRSDILISRNSVPLAIIETKAPAHDLTKDDAYQAISYARLLSTIAPFAIVTNGKETKVYDVLASELTPVNDPQNSLWHRNGQQLLGINDELRYEATKLLIAINPDTLRQFCEQQVATGLIDLKSDVRKNKKYIPELYVERHSLSKAFTDWLKGELPIFAVIAPSGYGKTNFMCAEAEKAISSNFALFYSSERFTSGLVNSIRNDFIWEFHREKELVQIFDRLDTIAKNTGKKLLIFVDAIDENPSGTKTIKNELLDVVTKIRRYPNIRIILSCKSFDWPYVIVDGGQSFNLLAETIEPSTSRPERRSITPDAEKVGFHLAEFINDELDKAITKYKSAYSIEGDFHGEILDESHNPLMLRFIAEIYGEGREKLPTSISSLELFNLYLQRKLEPVENSSLAEIILYKAASLIFASGIRSVPKEELISDIAWSESYEKALQNLFRLGVLSRTTVDEQERVGFEFNKFLLYIFVFKVKKFQTLSVENQVLLLHELLESSIGIEALDFCLAATGQKVAHKLLTELANQDFSVFARIITDLKSLENYKKSPIPFEHILYYLEFYNFLRDKFFGELSNSIMPYTKMPLGVIFIMDRPELFRACTQAYPQPIAKVSDKTVIQQLFNGPISKQLDQDLMPVGAYHIGGIHEFAEYPQKASYKHLLSEVSSALSNRLLNESSTRDILQERVYGVLLHGPSVWVSGDDLPHERYWKILGFDSIEELGNTKVSELSKRINDLLNRFNAHLKKRGNLYSSYLYRSNELFATLFALSLLDENSSLGLPQYSLDILWEHKGTKTETFIDEVKKLIPTIIKNYKLLFTKNFPSLAHYSHFLANVDKLSILEIRRLGGFSDFPAFSYIVCPNIDETIPTKVIITSYNQSLTDKLNFKSLYGEGYAHSMDSGCGFIQLDTTIDKLHIHDPKAWVIKTRFPSRTPILDQVYSLISHDLKFMFNANHMQWKDDLSSQLVNAQYLRFAAKSITNRQNNTRP